MKLELFKMYHLILVGSNRHEHHLLSEHAAAIQGRSGVRKVDVARTYDDALESLASYHPGKGRLVLVADAYAFANKPGWREDTAALMVAARDLGGKVVFHGGVDNLGSVHSQLAHHFAEKSSKTMGCSKTFRQKVVHPVLASA